MLYFKDLVTPIDGFYKGQIGIVVMENTDPNANGPKKYQVSFGGQWTWFNEDELEMVDRSKGKRVFDFVRNFWATL